ncbi:MAG: serine hydrolase domain-containing protein, partial [Gemmatimonadota bacterium]|nr:serine hydrolase domain-containing protein [Gemmatimonadota bacterium]
MYDGALPLDLAVNTFRNIDRLFATRGIHHAAQPLTLPRDPQPLTELAFTSRGAQRTLDDYVRLNNVTGLLALHNGRIVLERYARGNTEHTRWMSMSVAKSVTSTLIGAAVRQGRIGSINDQVVQYVPVLKGSAYDGATVRDVLMMSSGVKWV